MREITLGNGHALMWNEDIREIDGSFYIVVNPDVGSLYMDSTEGFVFDAGSSPMDGWDDEEFFE